MPHATREQAAEYFANAGDLCPLCESESIYFASTDHQTPATTGLLIVAMLCDDCGHEWQANYKLVSINDGPHHFSKENGL